MDHVKTLPVNTRAKTAPPEELALTTKPDTAAVVPETAMVTKPAKKARAPKKKAIENKTE
jgi:hypothetical protein